MPARSRATEDSAPNAMKHDLFTKTWTMID